MRYPVNPGVFHYTAKTPRGTYSGTFRPSGKVLSPTTDARLGSVGATKLWETPRTLAARIIVGFNVDDQPRWTIDDLIPIVRDVRMAQAGDPGATFVMQKGLYQHHDPKKGVVSEDGAQIIIIDPTATSDNTFESQMLELAEKVAVKLQQEMVILELQVNGVTQKTIGVGP